MTSNTSIWDALCRTDPAHTKPFNRSGGFKGTAVKPIWITKRLTEQFGPAGVGWGVNEPQFQVVQCEDEVLVYCTVSTWHGDRANLLWGVGGDKVQAKRSSGVFCDDEAFKKAFTDAIGNAFKSLGVSADIHMGQFDDDKYVREVGREFAAQEPVAPAEVCITDDQRDAIASIAQAANVSLQAICGGYGIASLKELPAAKFDAVLKRLRLSLPSSNEQKAA